MIFVLTAVVVLFLILVALYMLGVRIVFFIIREMFLKRYHHFTNMRIIFIFLFPNACKRLPVKGVFTPSVSIPLLDWTFNVIKFMTSGP